MKLVITDLEAILKTIKEHNLQNGTIVSNVDGKALATTNLSLDRIKSALEAAIEIHKGIGVWAEVTTANCPGNYLPASDKTLLQLYKKFT